MAEWLMVIAALCSVHSSTSAYGVDVTQAKCQAYYAKCLGPEWKGTAHVIECMKERKP